MVKKKSFFENFSSMFTSSKESGNLYSYLQNDVIGTMQSKFAKDIYNRQEIDLHEEKRRCKKYYRENSLIHAAAKTMIDLVLGDNFIIESKNEALKLFMESSLLEKKGFVKSYYSAIEDCIVTGDGFIEIARNDKEEIIGFSPINYAEDIYIDFDYKKNIVKRYIQRIQANDVQRPKASQFNITSPNGRETVYGVEINKNNILHIKYGNENFGVYGRSSIASVLEDVRILEEIERSIAIITKYKAVPRIALIKGLDENEEEPTQEELNYAVENLKNLSDFDNPILAGKWSTIDLSNGGKDIRLEGYIDYLKRKITIALAPEFLIHGENTNRATSKEQKQLYFLRIQNIRRNPEKELTNILREFMFPIQQKDKNLLGTFKFYFGEFDITIPEIKQENTRNLFTDGIITINEAREELQYEKIEGGDVFKWETNINSEIPTQQNDIEQESNRK